MPNQQTIIYNTPMKPQHTTNQIPPVSDPFRDGLADALHEAHQEILDLRLRLAEYEWVESALQNRTQELGERVKELECLFLISHSLCRSRMGFAETFENIVNNLPKGFRYPDRTWARLTLTGDTFCSRGFRTAAVSHSVDIVIHGQRAGKLRVFVHPPPGPDEMPPILPMEKALVETVGLWIETTAAHRHDPNRRKSPANWWERLKAVINRHHKRP